MAFKERKELNSENQCNILIMKTTAKSLIILKYIGRTLVNGNYLKYMVNDGIVLN